MLVELVVIQLISHAQGSVDHSLRESISAEALTGTV